jgi:hypothetical protein
MKRVEKRSSEELHKQRAESVLNRVELKVG